MFNVSRNLNPVISVKVSTISNEINIRWKSLSTVPQTNINVKNESIVKKIIIIKKILIIIFIRVIRSLNFNNFRIFSFPF